MQVQAPSSLTSPMMQGSPKSDVQQQLTIKNVVPFIPPPPATLSTTQQQYQSMLGKGNKEAMQQSTPSVLPVVPKAFPPRSLAQKILASKKGNLLSGRKEGGAVVNSQDFFDQAMIRSQTPMTYSMINPLSGNTQTPSQQRQISNSLYEKEVTALLNRLNQPRVGESGETRPSVLTTILQQRKMTSNDKKMFPSLREKADIKMLAYVIAALILSGSMPPVKSKQQVNEVFKVLSLPLQENNKQVLQKMKTGLSPFMRMGLLGVFELYNKSVTSKKNQGDVSSGHYSALTDIVYDILQGYRKMQTNTTACEASTKMLGSTALCGPGVNVDNVLSGLLLTVLALSDDMTPPVQSKWYRILKKMSYFFTEKRIEATKKATQAGSTIYAGLGTLGGKLGAGYGAAKGALGQLGGKLGQGLGVAKGALGAVGSAVMGGLTAATEAVGGLLSALYNSVKNGVVIPFPKVSPYLFNIFTRKSSVSSIAFNTFLFKVDLLGTFSWLPASLRLNMGTVLSSYITSQFLPPFTQNTLSEMKTLTSEVKQASEVSVKKQYLEVWEKDFENKLKIVRVRTHNRKVAPMNAEVSKKYTDLIRQLSIGSGFVAVYNTETYGAITQNGYVGYLQGQSGSLLKTPFFDAEFSSTNGKQGVQALQKYVKQTLTKTKQIEQGYWNNKDFGIKGIDTAQKIVVSIFLEEWKKGNTPASSLIFNSDNPLTPVFGFFCTMQDTFKDVMKLFHDFLEKLSMLPSNFQQTNPKLSGNIIRNVFRTLAFPKDASSLPTDVGMSLVFLTTLMWGYMVALNNVYTFQLQSMILPQNVNSTMMMDTEHNKSAKKFYQTLRTTAGVRKYAEMEKLVESAWDVKAVQIALGTVPSLMKVFVERQKQQGPNIWASGALMLQQQGGGIYGTFQGQQQQIL